MHESQPPTLTHERPTHLLADDRSNPPSMETVRVFVVVEGINDIQFLKHISAILYSDNTALPHLARWEQQDKLIFVPTGGDPFAWTDRLAPLHKPELHLSDREVAPETELRQKAAACVNLRPGCRALLTSNAALKTTCILRPCSKLEAWNWTSTTSTRSSKEWPASD